MIQMIVQAGHVDIRIQDACNHPNVCPFETPYLWRKECSILRSIVWYMRQAEILRRYSLCTADVSSPASKGNAPLPDPGPPLFTNDVLLRVPLRYLASGRQADVKYAREKVRSDESVSKRVENDLEHFK